MTGRSLQASAAGIMRAKTALTRKNLTQKAIVNDLGIASWSTVNKFFNGKPVDRLIFIEICEALDLQWQEMATVPSLEAIEPEIRDNSTDELLAIVQRHTAAARVALDPRILERIERAVVYQKYLPAIQRGLDGNQRVVSIIGPAGYGKSTMLGHIYDQLIQDHTSWVALVLCSSLHLEPNSSTENLAIALGENVCGTQQSVLSLASTLNGALGRGVLLLDTIDLIINRPFISAFCSVLRQLVADGTTVVFTCRDHEYNDFLEPTREKLTDIAESVDRYNIPEFSVAEVREAAVAFVNKQGSTLSDGGRTFADRLLTLSAHTRSIQEITRNPLLLALLCDLFAKDGDVPPDLTVSKLYKQYWHEKIAYSRIDASHSSLLAIAKEDVCLTVAKALFEMSKEKLCESAYRDELGINFTEISASAYDDLLSEGVLERLPSTKIHFFHQTLLEYAIAYWLTRHSANLQRNQLITTVRQSDATHSHSYWWPMIRQLLTIVETDEEFEQIQQQLDINNVAAFGAVAFAAASRDRPSALLKLLPTALSLGEAYQKRLRLALESAPRQLALEIWSAMLTLLQHGGQTTAVNTAKSVSALLARWWESLGDHLDQALEAIALRTPVTDRNHQSLDDRPIIVGWLLQQCFPILREAVDLLALSTLRRYYSLLGSKSCGDVLHLHLRPQVPREAQLELLAKMLTEPIPNSKQIEEDVTTFLSHLLPVSLDVGQESVFPDWLAALHTEYPKGWEVVQGRAVGRCAANNSAVLEVLLNDLLLGDERNFRRNRIAIAEAVRLGSADFVTSRLVTTSLGTISQHRLYTLASLLKDSASDFDQNNQELIAQWLAPIVHTYADRFILLFEALADASQTARRVLFELIEQLPQSKKEQQRARILRFSPIEQHPPLSNLDKESQLILIRLYRSLAPTNQIALAKLLEASVGAYKEVAVAASGEFHQIAAAQLSIAQLLPLLKSNFPGVRVNSLTAIAHLVNQGTQLTDEELTAICTALARENNQAVARPLCELVAAWVQTCRRVPPEVAQAIGSLTPRLVVKGTLEGGTGRVIIAALKAIAQTEAKELNSQLICEWTSTFLKAIDIIRIESSESEVVSLLSAVDRLDKSFLPKVVTDDCPKLAQAGWTRNICAIAKAIKRVENQHSTLLDEILTSDWCTQEIKGVILELKGA